MTLMFVRYWLPAIVVVGGIVLMAAGGEIGVEGGFAIVGAGLSVALLNYLYRVGAKGDEERVAEVAARDYYDEHGRWPDD